MGAAYSAQVTGSKLIAFAIGPRLHKLYATSGFSRQSHVWCLRIGITEVHLIDNLSDFG